MCERDFADNIIRRNSFLIYNFHKMHFILRETHTITSIGVISDYFWSKMSTMYCIFSQSIQLPLLFFSIYFPFSFNLAGIINDNTNNDKRRWWRWWWRCRLNDTLYPPTHMVCGGTAHIPLTLWNAMSNGGKCFIIDDDKLGLWSTTYGCALHLANICLALRLVYLPVFHKTRCQNDVNHPHIYDPE